MPSDPGSELCLVIGRRRRESTNVLDGIGKRINVRKYGVVRASAQSLPTLPCRDWGIALIFWPEIGGFPPIRLSYCSGEPRPYWAGATLYYCCHEIRTLSCFSGEWYTRGAVSLSLRIVAYRILLY